jgi:tripartite-type tricarboxylate transporter receptor subunit TctC
MIQGASALPYLRNCTAALLCAAVTLTPAFAQTYPTKPIRILMPFGTGGTDLVTRWLASKLSPVLGQQVLPEPRTGAGGNIAHEAVARAPADGYTLLMAAPPVVINPALNPKSAYDPLRDFAPIALTASIPSVLVVHPSVPARSLRELVQLARSHPGKLAYASGGIGSTPHLAGELLKSLTRTNIVHVPYKGAALGLIGAMSGEVDMVIAVSNAVAPYVKDSRMRPLAVLDTKRVTALPDVPTAAESGMPQLLAVNFYILLAPAGTPRPIIERLNAETVKIMSSAETRERLAAAGAEISPGTPEQASEFLRAEHTRWSKVITDARIKAE